RAVVRILRTLRVLQPDVVHIQYPTRGYGKRAEISFLPFLIRCAFPRVKIVSTIHEFTNRTVLGKVRLLIPIVFSHKAIIVEQQYARDIEQLVPGVARKLVYIPVGANISPEVERDEVDVNQLRKSLGVEENGALVSYFGVLRPGKGIPLLLESFAQLRAVCPGSKLLLLGHIDETYYAQSVRPLLDDERLRG